MRILDGAVIMIICVVVAAVLALFGGIIIDEFYYQVESAGLWNNIPTAWQGTGTLFSMINLYYFGCIALAGAGVLIFLLAVYENEANDTRLQYYG